jgi:DNA-binding transcriptional regulator YiaG
LRVLEAKATGGVGALSIRYDWHMPNLAAFLKSEIARIARKETKGELQTLRRAVMQHRSDVAALKRRVGALEQQVKRLSKASSKANPEPEGESQNGRLRFSAKGFASQRHRLGLSAEECGALIGASALSVYNWEKGKVRPRDAHLPAIAALRKMGKKEATARLEALHA